MQNNFEEYIDNNLCSRCGGACCKRCPGIYSPNDFKSLAPRDLAEIISNEHISIRFYSGDPRERGKLNGVLYLRPMRENEDKFDVDLYDNGFCIHLISYGCSLPREKRPYQCLALKPGLKDGKTHCRPQKEDKSSVNDLVTQWIKYQGKIKKALKILHKQNIIETSQLKTILDHVEP